MTQVEVNDDLFNKALFQHRAAVMDILAPLRRYGQSDYVDMIIEPLNSLAVQLHYRLCGEMWDEPMDPNKPRVWMP